MQIWWGGKYIELKKVRIYGRRMFRVEIGLF